MLWLLPAQNKKHIITVEYGFLISPTGGVKHVADSDKQFGIDNDAFNGKFNKDKFLRLLDKMVSYKDRCLFVNPPDVVGDAVQTTENYYQWYNEIKGRGLPILYILQDGWNLQLPKPKADCIFVGGSTEFKLSNTVMRLLQVVNPDYWVHIGRVNTYKRLLHFRHVADSFDGTQIYRFQPDIGVKLMQKWLGLINKQQELGL